MRIDPKKEECKQQQLKKKQQQKKPKDKTKNAVAAKTYRDKRAKFEEDFHMNHELLRLFIIACVDTFPCNINANIIPISAYTKLVNLSIPENVNDLISRCGSAIPKDTTDDITYRLSVNELNITDGYYDRCFYQHQLNTTLPFSDSDSVSPDSMSQKNKVRERIKKFRHFQKQNLSNIIMNIHYMILLLELTGNWNPDKFKLKNHDKFLKKYSVSKYLSIFKQSFDIYDQFVIQKTPTCSAFVDVIEIVKNDMKLKMKLPV